MELWGESSNTLIFLRCAWEGKLVRMAQFILPFNKKGNPINSSGLSLSNAMFSFLKILTISSSVMAQMHSLNHFSLSFQKTSSSLESLSKRSKREISIFKDFTLFLRDGLRGRRKLKCDWKRVCDLKTVHPCILWESSKGLDNVIWITSHWHE